MVASLFLALALGIYYLKSNRGVVSGLYLSAAVVFFIAFLLTYSRSGFLGFIVAIIAFLGLGYRQIVRQLILRSAGSLLVALLLLLAVSLPMGRAHYLLDKAKRVVAYNLERLSQPFKLEASSTVSHLFLGKVGLEMFARSPIIGFGMGNYGQYYGRYIEKGKLTETSHSSYINFFAESGMLGGIGLLWISFAFLFVPLRMYSRSAARGPGRVLAIGFLAGALAYFVSNVFYFYITHEYVWLYLGLGLAANNLFAKKEHFPEASS